MLSVANHILFVFEGSVTEQEVFDHLKSLFTGNKESSVLIAYHCGEIYSLYHKMKNDPDLDLIGILQEIPGKNQSLAEISRRQISEIYLFFDYDGHAPAADDAKLKEQLKHFDNETENGKLFISYPMVEAIRHIKDGVDFKDVTAKKNLGKSYKHVVNSKSSLPTIKNLGNDDWKRIVSEHCKKLNYLMHGDFVFPARREEQIDIFEQQLTNHITPHDKVAILSAFPIFLLDYYGVSKLSQAIS